MKLAKAALAHSNYEYGCDLRRLYPWENVADPMYWGAAIASVRPAESTTPHSHDESETFIVMSGAGTMSIESECEAIESGDVVYIPKNQHHFITNSSETVPLTFLTIFWDSPEARQRLKQNLGAA